MRQLVFKILVGLLVLISVLTLIGMAFGPFSYDRFSVTMSGIACALSVFGIAAALRFWKTKE